MVFHRVSRMENEVAIVLAAAPEFVGRYLDLVEAADGDPGAAAAFTELADHVSGLMAGIERFRPALVRCLEGVESVSSTSADGADLVAWAFLDSLSPDDRRRLGPWLGPHTRALLEGVESGD